MRVVVNLKNIILCAQISLKSTSNLTEIKYLYTYSTFKVNSNKPCKLIKMLHLFIVTE